ncbi:MAG TPA: ABC transporter substrate-binding protein, partial [Pyrinomonadaceae bacterium]|nr:ABC transporter substrate-binding protein [Pyrinomonadaceae bacterium]
MVESPGTKMLKASTTLVLSAALLLAAAAPLGGCGRKQRPAEGATGEQQPDKTFRLGAFMSLTGDTAQYGLSAMNGIRLAVEEANARGGVAGRRVELIVQDTRSDAAETERVVRRLAAESRAHALIGEIVSSRSLAAAPVAQAERVVMLTPSSTSPEVTAVGDFI